MALSSIAPIFEALRPRQWIKNLVVFAPLVFAAQFLDPTAIIRNVLAFLILCAISGAVYLVNDARDVREDRQHPSKKYRPIARGALSVPQAYVIAACLFVLGGASALFLGPLTCIAVMGFVAVNGIYTFGAKRVAILDVMLIALSFVMRVLVGAAAILVPPSAWLLLTLFTLATYLGFTKRVAELRLGTTHGRSALAGYTPAFLDHARSATLAVTLALYTLYTFDSPYGQAMAMTVPFVFFGLLRYQAIVDADTGKNDGPSDHMYLDRQLQVTVLLWGLAVCAVILAQP